MSCAHSFGEWCSECIAGVVTDFNKARAQIRTLEARVQELEREVESKEHLRGAHTFALKRIEELETEIKHLQGEIIRLQGKGDEPK